jgi:hypothetical protein
VVKQWSRQGAIGIAPRSIIRNNRHGSIGAFNPMPYRTGSARCEDSIKRELSQHPGAAPALMLGK